MFIPTLLQLILLVRRFLAGGGPFVALLAGGGPFAALSSAGSGWPGSAGSTGSAISASGSMGVGASKINTYSFHDARAVWEIKFLVYSPQNRCSLYVLYKSDVKWLNTLGQLDQYMAQHGRIVKQSYCETVLVTIFCLIQIKHYSTGGPISTLAVRSPCALV